MYMKYKKLIPNILTSLRLIFTPIIIILGFMEKYDLVIILVILCSLSDLFDGKLARKWNVISDFGAKLDTVADKAFAISLIACLIKNIKLLTIPLILEFLIAFTNLYFYYKKTHETHSLPIGKIKTTSLFITIIVAMISIFYSQLLFLVHGFIYVTINLQVLSFISYIEYFKDFEIKTKTPKDKKIYDVDLEKTKQIDNLTELITKYEKEA